MTENNEGNDGPAELVLPVDASYANDTAFSSVSSVVSRFAASVRSSVHAGRLASMDFDESSFLYLRQPFVQPLVRDPLPSTAFRYWRRALIILPVLLYLALGRTISKHSSASPAKPKRKDRHEDRTSAFRACAAELSPRLQCPKSTLCEELEEFFLHEALAIEIDDTSCSWNSDFGLVLSLLVLRDSLGLQNQLWHPTKHLMRAKDVCTWKRVKCQDPGRGVTDLIFNHVDSLNGTIPTEIRGLVDLEVLELYSNQGLRGPIPTEMGELTSLTSLQLQKSSVSGTIPVELASLKNLQTLLLDETQLTGTMPDSICEMTKSGKLLPPHISCFSVACSCCKCRSS